ncbi:hypothetical protein Tco_1360365 [Tanacetum coccineum]
MEDHTSDSLREILILGLGHNINEDVETVEGVRIFIETMLYRVSISMVLDIDITLYMIHLWTFVFGHGFKLEKKLTSGWVIRYALRIVENNHCNLDNLPPRRVGTDSESREHNLLLSLFEFSGNTKRSLDNRVHDDKRRYLEYRSCNRKDIMRWLFDQRKFHNYLIEADVDSFHRNKRAVNIKRIGHDIVQDSIWEQDDDSEEDQEEDGDDEDTFYMWDITVEDVERIRKFFNVPDEIDEIGYNNEETNFEVISTRNYVVIRYALRIVENNHCNLDNLPPRRVGTDSESREIDIENMALDEYREYEAEKERRFWDNARFKNSPTSIYEQEINLEKEEAQDKDGDDGDTFDMWDITVKDVERIWQFFNVPNKTDKIVQPLIPEPIHTTPPNDNYVAPATKLILDELFDEFKNKILNVTMVDKEADFNPTKGLEEFERLLAMRPQTNLMKIQVYYTNGAVYLYFYPT